MRPFVRFIRRSRRARSRACHGGRAPCISSTSRCAPPPPPPPPPSFPYCGLALPEVIPIRCQPSDSQVPISFMGRESGQSRSGAARAPISSMGCRGRSPSGAGPAPVSFTGRWWGQFLFRRQSDVAQLDWVGTGQVSVQRQSGGRQARTGRPGGGQLDGTLVGAGLSQAPVGLLSADGAGFGQAPVGLQSA